MEKDTLIDKKKSRKQKINKNWPIKSQTKTKINKKISKEKLELKKLLKKYGKKI